MAEVGFQKGHPRWGGKKKGQKNRATIERERRSGLALANAIEKLGIPQATLDDLTPVSIMQFVMIERFRVGDHVGAMAAAQGVAPYLHPKLAITDMRITNTIAEKSYEELLAERETLAQKLLSAEQTIEGAAVELKDPHFPAPSEAVQADRPDEAPEGPAESAQP